MADQVLSSLPLWTGEGSAKSFRRGTSEQQEHDCTWEVEEQEEHYVQDPLLSQLPLWTAEALARAPAHPIGEEIAGGHR